METTKSTMNELRERRENILTLLTENSKKSATVKYLAKHFNISEMTVRRDLDFLESHNLITRFHGGAKLSDQINNETNDNLYIKKIKKEIAKKASEYVENSSTIYINSGETALNVIDYLEELALVIMSNNLNIYKKQTNYKTTTLLTGGEIREPRDVLVGDLAVNSLKDIHSDIAILSCNGISAEFGISTNNLHESKVNKTMIDNTKQLVIIVADYQKVGKSTNFIVDELTSIDILITDIYADKNEIEKIEDLGVTVIQVEI